METLPNHFLKYPELLQITKPKSSKRCIYYSEERYNHDFVDSLVSVYKYYFEIEPVLILPHCKCESNGSLESLEQLSILESSVIIFAYADIFLNDLTKINKRRLNTFLKICCKKASKILILSITTLKTLQLPILESFDLLPLYSSKNNNFFKNLNLSLFDLVDPDNFTFESNVDSFVEMIQQFKNKSIYISLSLSIPKILFIESKLKESGIITFRKEQEKEFNYVLLNSAGTTEKTFLKHTYSVYIFVLPNDLERLDLIYYFKDILSETTEEVYIESSSNDYIESCLMSFYKEKAVIPVIQDSKEEFDSVESIKYSNLGSLNLNDLIFASENYYRIHGSDTIQKMDLKNLTKKDYDIIRNFIKLKLNCKYDLDIRTCQLSTPSSPKDRSKKLNSLSNKISSIDYRCDVTIEIFKDYSIGVVIWTDIFSSKEKINVLKNEVYVYQTTSGKWKITKVN